MAKSIRISGGEALSVLPVSADTVIRRFVGDFHCHTNIEIWYVLGGEMKHIIDGREYLQTPGTFALIRPYIVHTTDTTVSEETPVIFSARAHEKAIMDAGYDCFIRHSKICVFEGREIPEFLTLEGEWRAEADAAARRLLDEDFRKYPESPAVRCRLFADFLRIVSRGGQKRKISNALRERTAAINNAVDYITENYKKKITLEELSSNAIMSKRRFTENFRAVTGMTTGDMVHIFRMFDAEQRVVFSENTIEEIGRSLGYYDKASFSHAFRSHFGMPPSEFRERNREDSYRTESEERLKRRRRYETLNYYYALKNNGAQLDKSFVTHMPNLI